MGEFLENAGYIFDNLNSQSKIDESAYAILSNQNAHNEEELTEQK
jgi:hypothetical protein